MSKAKSPKENDLYAGKKRVAARYGCSTRTVNNWVQAGVLPPPLRFSRQTVLWSVEQLDEFDKRRLGTTISGVGVGAA